MISTEADSGLDERLSTAFCHHPHLSRGNLRLEHRAGRVTLRGVVPTFYQKQLAQELLRRIDGVSQICNELEVSWA